VFLLFSFYLQRFPLDNLKLDYTATAFSVLHPSM
jgi:hypothetical protein